MLVILLVARDHWHNDFGRAKYLDR